MHAMPDDHEAPETPKKPSSEHNGSSPVTGNQRDDAPSSRSSSRPPPLPERPKLLTPAGSIRGSSRGDRQNFSGLATTAVQRTDVQSTSPNAREPALPPPGSTNRPAHSRRSSIAGSLLRFGKYDDGASIRSKISKAPTAWLSEDVESLIGLGTSLKDDKDGEPYTRESVDDTYQNDSVFTDQFQNEFVELDELESLGATQDELSLAFSQKLKHFLILSSAGKPIYSRHGSDALTTPTVGVIQTIISTFQQGSSGEQDELKSFVAGDARFVVLSKKHLHLVATSRLPGENELQLRSQLDALYMQILSTLTLPTMEKMFLNRPSTDLRRPLQGTETLLSALADGFTRGSPSTLLSALECLKLRKAHRQAINNTFVKARSPGLLYGLIVAGGRLVSVLRPRKHSLHPGDLQLIFNMLFEAGAVRAGGDESWIPLCLPGFNNTGYVHMYVSFLPIPTSDDSMREHEGQQKVGEARREDEEEADAAETDASKEITVLLITAQKDSLDDLKTMRERLLENLETSHAIQPVYKAVSESRPEITTLFPGTALRHFLFKSRIHVQYLMPSAKPFYEGHTAWRKLMCTYAELHGAVHNGKQSHAGHAKVQHIVTKDEVCVSWTTQEFEVYAVASRSARRDAIIRGIEKVIRWAKTEEERLFVIGGAVF